MARFIIHTLKDKSFVKLLYDSATSALTYEDGTPVIEVTPKQYKDADRSFTKNHISTLKISLGMSCNYSCQYCTQRFVPGQMIDAGDWQAFIKNLPTWFDVKQSNPHIEFWGGEPLVYWKTLKPLAEALKEMMPTASFLMITNGSLLSPEINQWLDEFGMRVGISHDGVGQKYRGVDPLDDAEKLANIQDLYRRLHPKKLISFNAVLHKDNQSRAAIVEFFKERFGNDMSIGEGLLIHAGSDFSLQMSLGSLDEQYAYRRQAYSDIRSLKAVNVMIPRQKIKAFIDSVKTARPASALYQGCHMDAPHTLAVDLKGDTFLCQNVVSKLYQIGNVNELEDVKLAPVSHWTGNEKCKGCPVLQICQGACMRLDGEQWNATCRNYFSDSVVFFAAAIEIMTEGCIPFLVESENNHWWIFGDASVKNE